MTNKTNEMTKNLMFTTMRKVNDIGHALEDKDFKKAHDLRDKLFSYVINELTMNTNKYTKREIEEFLNVLSGVDDWGV